MLKKYVLSSVYAAIVGAHVAGVAGYTSEGMANVALFAFLAASTVIWLTTLLVLLSPRETVKENVEGVVREKGVEVTQHSPVARTMLNTLYLIGALALAYHGAFAQAAILVGLTLCVQAAQSRLDSIEAEVVEEHPEAHTCPHRMTRSIDPATNNGKALKCADCGWRFNPRDRREAEATRRPS